MKKILFALLMALPALAGAAGPAVDLMNARVDVSDQASLQRGAKLFMGYCVGCHALSYQRYSRLAQDLGLPDDLVEQYLILTDAKIGETIQTSMNPADAERWFGVVPPDLSLTARRRGEDWIYTYLNSFYRDESKAVGVNNLVFPDVGMPHVLWELQGMPEPQYAEVEQDGEVHKVLTGIKVEEGSGSLSARDYREATRDITAFLTYVGEPVKAYRQSLGIKVLLFLFVFLIVAYLLKKEFWKDVH
jgi:ubiquinol-cytochrome c reductase cytochrome c1 subunit